MNSMDLGFFVLNVPEYKLFSNSIYNNILPIYINAKLFYLSIDSFPIIILEKVLLKHE